MVIEQVIFDVVEILALRAAEGVGTSKAESSPGPGAMPCARPAHRPPATASLWWNKPADTWIMAWVLLNNKLHFSDKEMGRQVGIHEQQAAFVQDNAA